MAGLLDEAASEPLPPIRCDNCSRTLPAGTVICVACGYNLRTRQQLATVVERPPEEGEDKKGLKAAAGFAGSYVIGCIACTVATAIGMGIWIGVAVATGYEIGWIAWGLGVLAGLGMRLGYGKEDDVAGITAAFIALFGILGTKWVIFQALLAILEQAAALQGLGGESLPSHSTLFFVTMVGWAGPVFLLLAFFTAYRVGSGKSFS